MSEECVPTGVEGLDDLIGGGFRRGSLILLASNPGTGKTVFGARFICKGASDLDEAGVYVSFSESRKTFVDNMLRHLGRDCENCLKKGKCIFLDLVTVKEKGISNVLETILAKVHEVKARRLVIDSYSAMAQAFERKIDARIVVHTILGKLVRGMGCTTILISEVRRGEARIGIGVEEFVTDGLIILRRDEFDGRPIREAEIPKLRGVEVTQPLSFFTLRSGFHLFPPFKLRAVEEARRFQPIPDSETHFSTGSEDLDSMLEGGYPKGGVVFVEIGSKVSVQQYHLILIPTIMDFMCKGRGCISFPSFGLSIHQMSYTARRVYGLTDEEFDSLIRIFVQANSGIHPAKPYIMTLKGDLQADFSEVSKIEADLCQRTKRQPIVYAISLDSLDVTYGGAVVSELARLISRSKMEGNLVILHARPGAGPHLTQRAADISDTHLKIVREHGTLLVYGQKPRTGIYITEMDVSKGYPLPKLTPIT